MAKTLVLSINTTWNLINFRRDLIRRLLAEGYTLVALSPPSKHDAALEALGVRHVPLAIDNKGLSPVLDLRLLAAFRRELRAIRPAAFLGWTIKPNVYGSLAAQSLGIPVINNISGLGTAFIKRSPLTVLVKWLYRLALARSATVFFQNRHDRDLFVAAKLVRAAQASLLPGSGIDLDRFAPRAGAEEGQPFSFLLVARLLRDKGVVEFAEAARLVRAARPQVAFDLLGFVDVANRTAIARDVIERWEAAGVLRYLGDTDDVRPYLARAGAVVLPSYREGMPRSLLEAAAMGRPLIATDVPGCTEIARAGENAILCRPRDARSLAEAMLAMLDAGPARRAEMGRCGRAIATAEFDTALVERRYLEALASACLTR